MLVRELSFKKFYVSELTYKGQVFYSLMDPDRYDHDAINRLRTDKETLIEASGDSPEIIDEVVEELRNAKFKDLDQTKCRLKIVDLGLMRAITHVKINAN